jgi:putative aldouronate transport system substrate-binding protein
METFVFGQNRTVIGQECGVPFSLISFIIRSHHKRNKIAKAEIDRDEGWYTVKKLKKFTVAGMSTVMLASVVLTGCSTDQPTGQTQGADTPKEVQGLNTAGFPIMKENISLKFVARKNPQHGEWKDMLVLQEYEKMTGMKIEYETYPVQNFSERKNLLFASNELPDAFINSHISADEQLKFGTTGMLIPLEGLIEKYAPNIKALFNQYPDARKTVTAPDGHIYALPTVVTQAAARTQKMWINQQWLDKAGLKPPTTTDELYKTLKAFQEINAGTDAVPFSIDYASVGDGNLFANNPSMRGLTGVWGLPLQMGTTGGIENGKFKMWLDSDRLKDFVVYLNKLYKEKLLDNNSFTLDIAKVNAMTKSNKLGLTFNQTDVGMDNSIYKAVAYPKSTFGDPIVNSSAVARDLGSFAITNKNKYPEATMRWIDYFYGDEGSSFLRFGIEGKTYTKDASGNLAYTDEIMKDSRGYQVAIGHFTIWPGAGAPHVINEKNAVAVTGPAIMAGQKVIEPFMPKNMYGAPLMDPAIKDKYTSMTSDINKYVRETISKFIVEGVTDDKWVQYKQTLEKLGIKEYEGYFQKALDNYDK